MALCLTVCLCSLGQLASAYIDPCDDTAFYRARDFAWAQNYRLPAATFNWNFHYNPFTTPPGLTNPIAGQAIMAGAGGWNEKRTHSPLCSVGGASWTRFTQGANVSATPGVVDSWNTIGFQNFAFPVSNTNVDCAASMAASPNLLAVTCAWGSQGYLKGDIFQADVVLNSNGVAWTTDLSSFERIVQSVSTHEFGHVVGLAHVGANLSNSCSQDNDHFSLTMYPAYCASPNTGNSYRWVTLAKGDITGIFYVAN